MPPSLLVASLLLLLCSISDAKVEFTYSTMYNIYDFLGVKEVPLPRCNSGCLIFATTFGMVEANMDPYIKSLVIKDSVKGKMINIGELVGRINPDTTQKLPLDIPAAGNYSIVNLNPLDVQDNKYVWDVTVWIIERAIAHQIDYEIYDAQTMNRAPGAPASVITIMGQPDFQVVADKSWEVNSFTARLVGFDNAFDDNEDFCRSVMDSPAGAMFDDIRFDVTAPIISFVFANKTIVDLNANDSVDAVQQSLSTPGIIRSPTYIGCDRLAPDQAYQSKFDWDTRVIYVDGQLEYYQVEIDCISDLAHESGLEVIDETYGHSIPINGGRMHFKITLPKTQKVSLSYANVTAPHWFLMNYTATRINRLTIPPQTTSKTEYFNGEN